MMNRYDSYKDSGVQWIGEVPKHWELMKIKHLSRLITETSNNSTKVGLENIESFTGRFVETDSTFEGNGVEAQKGDILYGKLRPYLCKAWLATFNCNAVGDFYVFRCESDKCLTPYLHKIFLSHGFTGICNASTYGAKMPRVSSGFIQSLQIPIPPLPEQQAIVSYLDRKVGEIDEFVEGKEQLIAKLKELKQAVVAKAVTKGIDPNVKLKPSGISWIGDVPEHWEIDRLSQHFKERREKVSDKDYPALSVSKDGVVPQLETAVKTDNGDNRKMVMVGDFVVNSRSDRKGSCGLAYQDGSVSLINYYCPLKL